MACWIALWPPEPAQAEALAWWALQFTPRVACCEGQVCMDVQASMRLFGGAQALLQRLEGEAQALGVQAACVAPHAGAARAWVRQWVRRASSPTWAWHDARHLPWPDWFDALPLMALPEVAAHASTLGPMGCRHLGDVRRLPRAGLSRRLGPKPLQALDQAMGLQPEPMAWCVPPEVFDVSLELPGRVEQVEALLHAASQMVTQLAHWLGARQHGVQAFTLHWRHEGHARAAGEGGACTVRMADPTRDIERLLRVLSEHLQHLTLAGPVGTVRLRADLVVPQATDSGCLFSELDGLAHSVSPHAQARALNALLEHLSARLGDQQVRTGRLVPDHRPERAQRWGPWQARSAPVLATEPLRWSDAPAPTWLAPAPLPLALQGPRHGRLQPLYHGPLRLLAGPHRIEAGWWDRTDGAGVSRDYHLAHSPVAGLVWVFQSRDNRSALLAPETPPQWFLHGWLS